MKIEPEVLDEVLSWVRIYTKQTDDFDEFYDRLGYMVLKIEALLASVKEKKPSMCGIHGTENATQRQPYGSIRVWCPACADMAMQADLNDALAATETKPDAPSYAEREILSHLAGAASMCWKPIPSGTFDATLASKFVDEALVKLKSAQPKVKEVTVEEISKIIQKWHFDDSTGGPFGAYLMRLYPNGLRVIPAAGEKP